MAVTTTTTIDLTTTDDDLEIIVTPPAPRSRLPRTFWRLWSASTVSNVGNGLTFVALPLLAAGTTRNAGLVAGVVAMQRLPWLLLALPAGALADRSNRALVMGLADVVRAGVLLMLGIAAASGHLSIGLLYGLAFLLGAFDTLFAAASNAAVPAVVDGEDHLDRTNGLLFASETAGRELAGPALGGLLFAVAAAVPFVADGVSFLISGALLVGLRSRLAAPPRAERTSSVPRRRELTSEIAEGVRYFLGNDVLRVVALLITGLALCQSMVMGVLVVFALRALHLAPAGYGIFLAAGALGSVAGGLSAARVRARLGTTGVLLASAAASATAYLICGATSSVVVAGAAFVIETFAVACGSVASMSLRQTLVPDALRGRVGNAFRMCIWGVIPIGSVIGGVVAENFGLRAPFIAAGLAQLAITAMCVRPLRARVSSTPAPLAAAA